MRFICFLSILAFTEAFNDDPAEYTEYIVSLGDPWQVTCETPYSDPTQWWFNSALWYFNHYIYWKDKIVAMMEDRYIMMEITNPHAYTLKVFQTDKDHAGLYQCLHKNGTTEEGSQYYKLTLVGKSNIELLANENNSIKLVMSISYVGFNIQPPVFQCKFHYGDRIMNERKCIDDIDELSTCSLEIIYGPDDDPPLSCQISFESHHKIWNATKLSIVRNSFVSYVEEGEPYSVSCDTASTTSMSWYFNGVLPPTNESLLFASWTVQTQAYNRYNFTYSNESKTYSMMIAHVDVNHAGTYLCTHKTNRHLVAKKIELVVIEQSSIQFSGDNPITLIMSTSYIGHNIPTPLFQCMFHNKLITLDNKECLVTKNGSTKCHVEQVYDLHSDVPDKCQIWFEYFRAKEVTSKDDYIGCFKYVHSRYYTKITSIDQCRTFCKEKHEEISKYELFKYEEEPMIAFRNGQECYCVERIEAGLSSSLCDMKCQDGIACGDVYTYSVYKGKPVHQFCHIYLGDFDKAGLTFHSVMMDTNWIFEDCTHFCLEGNYSLFTIFDKKNCSCVVDSNRKVTGIGKTSTCENFSIFETSDRIPLFSNRFQLEFPTGHSSYSHCLKSQLQTISNCDEEGCVDGWKGKDCRTRDCSKLNGNCGDEFECVVNVVNGVDLSECVCPTGLMRNAFHKCEYIRMNAAFRMKVLLPYETVNYDYSLTDGDIIMHAYDLSTICRPWLVVYMVEIFNVAYVIAYHTHFLPKNTTCVDVMSGFTVGLNETISYDGNYKLSDIIQICGTWNSDIALGFGHPMKVVCADVTVKAQFVFIYKSLEKMTEFISISELEVYVVDCQINNGNCGSNICLEEQSILYPAVANCISFNISLERKRERNLVGCFYERFEINTTKTYTLEKCRDHCKTVYYGINRFLQCVCTDKINRLAQLKYCDVECEFGTPCPTGDFYYIYSEPYHKSTLIGCFKYVSFKNAHVKSNMTMIECFDYCGSVDTQFMAIKDTTCQCGDSINFFGQKTYQQCLTYPTTLFQIFQVTSEIDFIEEFKVPHFCMNYEEESDMPYCSPGVCTPGWKGATCDVRDCEVKNGNCKDGMICSVEKIYSLIYTQCICEFGFVLLNQTGCAEMSEEFLPKLPYVFLGLSLLSFLISTSVFVGLLCYLRKRKERKNIIPPMKAKFHSFVFNSAIKREIREVLL